MYKLKCIFCGKEFEYERVRCYCSNNCMYKSNNRKNNVSIKLKQICLFCKCEFESIRKKKYCSNDCMYSFNLENKNISYVKVEKEKSICLVCEKEFEVYRPFQKCCSQSCQAKNYYKNNKEKINEQSKKEYLKNADKRKETAKRYRDNNKEIIRKKDNEYKDKTRFGGNRQTCFDRDGNKCTECGSTHMLVPHHIDNTGQDKTPNNSLDNLITLCKKCHMKLHDPNPNKRNRVKCICKICNKEFEVVPSKIKNGRGKTCSHECKYKYWSLKKQGLIE